MRIVVLGAGTVGSWIADLLCQNRHSVTVVDHDAAHTRRINDELDVRAVTGSASQSTVLFQADVIGSDACLAVTGDDEVNIVAASMAKAMGARRSVARVYAPVFRDLSTFDYQRHFRIDRLLSLEHLTATELARGIRNPGSVLVENFARGALEVQEMIIQQKTKAVGVPLKELRLPSGVRLGSIQRDDRIWIAGADDPIEVGDRITLIGRREDIDDVKECAGSTGGGLKVIRHILFLKILWLEIEQAYHPSVVRPVRLAGVPWEGPDLRKNILAYFGLILVIFIFSWLLVVMVEPRVTWGSNIEHKLIDSASGIAATLNNIGPGLGTVGATQNYGHFSAWTKLLFIWLMMIGRLEIFSILVLLVPSFWRSR